MNLVTAATVAVDDATYIHATHHILELRVFHQHIVKLFGHHRPIEIDIVLGH